MKKHPAAWVHAMRAQGTSKPDDFPRDNRAARRLKASRKRGAVDVVIADIVQEKEVRLK